MTMLPEFSCVADDGRRYCEIVLPGGTFRMYEDVPYTWVPQPGSENWFWKGLTNMEGKK